MQRYDFHFLQKVTEAELDAAFEACEQAEQRTYTDLGMIGVLIGASVDEAAVPNLTVDVSAGVVVDQTGQRIRWSAIQNVDCSVDENSASTAVLTPGNSKILSVFAKFLRVNSDPRVDGEQATVFFNRAESFELRVAQGAEAVTPSPVALRSDQILLADITITFGQTAIVNANIDMVTRREWAITTSGIVPTDIKVGTVEEAVQALAERIDAANDASGVAYAGGGAWHDGTTNPATTVEAQLDKIISELADDSAIGNGGGDRVGIKGQTVSLFTLPNGSIFDQFTSMLTHLTNVNTFAHSGDWHDGGNIAATLIEGAINEVKNDLAADTGNGGADKVGAGAQTFGDAAVTAGSIFDQIQELMKQIDVNYRTSRAADFKLFDEIDTGFFAANEGFYKVIFDGRDSLNQNYLAVGTEIVTPANAAFIANNEILASVSSTWSKVALSGGTPDYLYDIIHITAAGFTSHPFIAVGQEDATPTDCAIYTATDGNGTYTKQTTSARAIKTIRGICFDVDSGYAIVVGKDASGNAAIARSNNGSTWSDATTIPAGIGELHAVAADENGNIVAVGEVSGGGAGRILTSTDGGNTWTQTGTTTDEMKDVVHEPLSDHFFACGGRYIARSTNNGASFSTINSADDERASLTACATDGKGLVVFRGISFMFILKHGPDGWSAAGRAFQTANTWCADNGGSFLPQTGEFVFAKRPVVGARPGVDVASYGSPIFTF